MTSLATSPATYVAATDSTRFYAFARIAFGLLAFVAGLGMAHRMLVFPNLDPRASHVAVLAVWLVLSAVVTAGWRARAAAGALAIVGAWMVTAGSEVFGNNHFYLAVLCVSLVAFSDCERCYAVRPRLGSADEWPRQLMKVQLTIVYLFAGLEKLNSMFLSGVVLDHYFGRAIGPMAPIASLLQGTSLVQPMAFLVVLLELSMAVLIWSKTLRPAVFACAIPLHAGMLLVADDWPAVWGISVFAALMFVLLSSFIDARERARLVVWDDNCSFCRRWVSLFRRLDVLHALRFVGNSEPAAYDGTGVTPEAANEAIQVVMPDGRIRAGFAGVQAILEVVPVVNLVAPFLSLPGVRQLGDRAYRHVAAQRTCAYEPDANLAIGKSGKAYRSL